jgi:ribonuclease T1
MVLAATLTLASCVAESRDNSRDGAQAKSTISTIRVSELPKQGQETLALIRQGGPFPYAKDNTVFGNRERLLPAKPRGHYREFTVKTPGSRDRGSRRIVCGGEIRDRAKSICYYTADHYASFKRIDE